MFEKPPGIKDNPLNFAAKADNATRAEKLHEQLLFHLKVESDALRAEGLPIDEECRIDPEAFKEILNPHYIKHDQKSVQSKERNFKKEEMGELLEITKTLAFNKKWFHERLIAVRTSKYDDYFNGVDELIFDRQTHQVLAAVDTTTNPNLKSKDLIKHIAEGAKVRYGLAFGKKGFVKQQLNDVPYFIISIKPDDLLGLSEELTQQKTGPATEKSEQNVLTLLLKEGEQFISYANPKLKEEYEKARILFQELKSS